MIDRDLLIFLAGVFAALALPALSGLRLLGVITPRTDLIISVVLTLIIVMSIGYSQLRKRS